VLGPPIPWPSSSGRPGRGAGTSCQGSLRDFYPVADHQHTIVAEDGLTYLEDNELLDRHRASADSLAKRGEVIVDIANYILGRFARQDFLQYSATNVSEGSASICAGTNLEVSFEILENSRLFISRPLTSVVFSPASSILTAAYFFLFRSKIRSKTASRSISRSL